MAEQDRRSFLLNTLASLGLAATVGWDPLKAFAQAGAPAGPRIIDVHHHFGPPQWVNEVRGRPLLLAPNTTWTPAKSIENMDKGGVASAVVSITNPGLWFGDRAVTNSLARACNEFGAKVVQDHPTRFGLFAAMPLPDADATLKEIDYAYSALKADGVGLFTNYGDTWLGNPAYRPVMEELNRRRAVVFVHPTAADCCKGLNYAPDVSPGTMEYGTDTTRAIMGLTFSGDAAKFPDIRFIWSHAGGTMPFLAGRIARADRTLKDREQRLPNGFIAEVKKFYYDVAGAANEGAIASLMKLVTSQQVLFGTDFPTGDSTDIVQSLSQLGFSESDLRAINRENAVRLLPRFQA